MPPAAEPTYSYSENSRAACPCFYASCSGTDCGSPPSPRTICARRRYRPLRGGARYVRRAQCQDPHAAAHRPLRGGARYVGPTSTPRRMVKAPRELRRIAQLHASRAYAAAKARPPRQNCAAPPPGRQCAASPQPSPASLTEAAYTSACRLAVEMRAQEEAGCRQAAKPPAAPSDIASASSCPNGSRIAAVSAVEAAAPFLRPADDLMLRNPHAKSKLPRASPTA